MSKSAQKIAVTSHVSRDLLQSAAVFNSASKIVWEYVSNSLDAARDDQMVNVVVTVKSDSIIVTDDGRGMSRSELVDFFKMHGVNTQRRRGKRVRGRFGTGKSAAFGLANNLVVDTVQNGLRNSVILTRADIERVSDGSNIPVRDVVVDEKINEKDGTTIKVSRFNSRKKHNIEKILSFVERHLSRYKGRTHVTINGHACKFEELPCEKVIKRYPPSHLREYTGNITLYIKVSPVKLDESRNGVDIFSNGIWHETTLVGIENKERSQFIFGEVDVPALEEKEWDIPPFDNTRSMKLNHGAPVVSMLLGWISEELEQIHRALVEEEKERRKSEQARKLAREAKRIANILNEDFIQQELELERARRLRSKHGSDLAGENSGENSDVTPGGGNIPSEYQEAGNPHGNGSRSSEAGEGDTPRPGPSLIEGNESGSKKKTVKGRDKRRRSVFSLDYENGTEIRPRSWYSSIDKTIYINLDHPQISRALQESNNNIYGKQFREMCYEVASVEYALALEYERIDKEDVVDPSDALYNVRDTINRITRRFVEVLSK